MLGDFGKLKVGFKSISKARNFESSVVLYVFIYIYIYIYTYIYSIYTRTLGMLDIDPIKRKPRDV